jgi:hypothetical protein
MTLDFFPCSVVEPDYFYAAPAAPTPVPYLLSRYFVVYFVLNGAGAVLILKERPLLFKRNKADNCFMKKFSSKSLILTCKIKETLQQLSICFLTTLFFTKFRDIF